LRDNGSNLSPTSQIEVLVVYGSQLLSGALTSLLVQDREVALVGAALTGQSAALCLQRATADVVLCVVRHEDDVADMISPILEVRPESRILVLGPTRGERAQFASIEAGAVGYVCEEIEPDYLLQAIKRIHAGEVVYEQSVLAGLTQRSAPGSRPGAQSVDTPTLAPREIEVLQAFVLGLSTIEVAERLGITVSTVRTHVKKALEKLGAHSKLEAAIIAFRQGIITLHQQDDG
jgi:DNA-binding NarL/FixJ family response regulator